VKEGQIQALWGLTLIQFLGPSLKKIQNFEYKFRESEYLFRMRKEIVTRYKLKALTNITNITKSQKNNIIYLLINCLTHLYNTFFAYIYLAAYSLITSSYDNNYIMWFPVEKMER
jgi:hypothetical protein